MVRVALILVALAVVGGERGTVSPSELPEFRSDKPVQGYFFARSSTKDLEALGGFSESYNLPKPITAEIHLGREVVEIRVDREELVPFRFEFVDMGYLAVPGSKESASYKGFRVLLINNTGEPLELGAQDSRLSIVREALDSEGKWRQVEFLPRSWCGNSYHGVTLAPRHYWSFAAPVYAGSHETRMRFRLGSRYSNEFHGSVDPKQFVVAADQ